MTRNSMDRAAAVSGIVAVVLIIISVVLTPIAPDPDAPLKDILSYFSDHHSGVLISAVLSFLSVPTFLLFAGGLRARVGRSAGDGDVALGFVTASAATLVGMVLLNSLLGAALGQWIAGLGDDHTVRAVFVLSNLSFGPLSLGTGTFLLAGAAAVLATRLLPAWLGWWALVFGVIGVVGGCSIIASTKSGVSVLGLVGLVGFLVFVLGTAIVQLREAPAR